VVRREKRGNETEYN
jgi:hypothetical protein